ncbi:Beta-lactamase/transpeptidase-like protein [Metarhizium rileyi]|uniref:Beta-lactamase/transpeptidase-like protein n=1 Tax=Metarhizium rileyi (strain RCEF 4871) TaxID=1649241 RepID=A0A166Z6Z3_METRR|nr:Beta-lactamase/transpeptidase-like protein [Metarhizium rileyi RCEF 4871]
MAPIRPLAVAAAAAALLVLPNYSGATTASRQKAVGLAGDDAKSPFTAELDTYINGLLEEWNVPGLSVAVVDGQEVHSRGYGFAVLPDTPAAPETLWHGGSTTKAFVDAALAELMASGEHPVLRGGWNTPISSIIRDDFVLQDEWATSHLTLEDAASHRTGMPRHDEAWSRLRHGKRVPNRDVVRNLRNLPLTAPPRVVLQYCNLMYITLSHVVETVTGKGLKDVLREAIWDPLGMRSTYLDRQDAADAGERLAQGYRWDSEAKRYEAVFDPAQESGGAGGIISNVVDYTKWLKCLLHRTEPLSNATHVDIRTPRMIYSPTPAGGYDVTLYGLGWTRTLFHGQIMYSHGGGTGSFGADVVWLPELRYAITAFGNTAGTSNSVETLLVRRLIEDRLAVPADQRIDMSDGMRKEHKALRDRIVHAVDHLFPDRPSPSLPQTQNTSLLAGTYFDPGYGTIQLEAQADPEDAASTVLVGYRGGMMIDFDLLLRRVSGDYWVLYLTSAEVPLEMGDALAAKFEFGSDGAPCALEIVWDKAVPGLREVRVRFHKVE